MEVDHACRYHLRGFIADLLVELIVKFRIIVSCPRDICQSDKHSERISSLVIFRSVLERCPGPWAQCDRLAEPLGPELLQ